MNDKRSIFTTKRVVRLSAWSFAASVLNTGLWLFTRTDATLTLAVMMILWSIYLAVCEGQE